MKWQQLNFRCAFAFAVAVLAATALPTEAREFTRIFHNVPGVTGNEVPGISGATFSSTDFGVFAVLTSSDYGDWAVSATHLDFGVPEDPTLSAYIVNGQVEAVEGDPAPFAPGETWSTFENLARNRFNSAGNFAFTHNTAGGSDASDEYILQNVSGTYSVVAQEGMSIPALSGAFYGNQLDTPVILDDGTVGFIADNITGGDVTGSDDSEIVVLGNSLIARNGHTIPAGQAGGAMETWDNFDNNGFYVTPGGNHYFLRGDLNGSSSSDDIWVYDGQVVIQEGHPVAGLGSTVDGSPISDRTFMDGAGNWYAIGENANGQEWVVRNGVKIAAEGESVLGGAEVWAQTGLGAAVFLDITGNSHGDYLLVGHDNSPAGSQTLLLLNGTEIVAREGDSLDLDGNGLYDDDAYLDEFVFFDIGLTDRGDIHFAARIRNDSGAIIGEGFFISYAVPEPASLALLLVSMGSLFCRRRRAR